MTNQRWEDLRGRKRSCFGCMIIEMRDRRGYLKGKKDS